MTLRVVGIEAEVADAIALRVASATQLDTLEDVLRWGGDVLEVVVQDEYTHDVIATHPSGVIDGTTVFLVFDTT